MKKLILGLLVITANFSYAKAPVFPHVYNYGYSAQVQVWNSTPRSVHCSGMIYLHTNKPFTESHFYSDFVFQNSTSFRTIYLRDTSENNRIRYVTHSIFCN